MRMTEQEAEKVLARRGKSPKEIENILTIPKRKSKPVEPILESRITPSAPEKKKYGSTKKEVDGILFDSTIEANYYLRLKDYKSLNLIKDFSLQPKFLLQEKFTTAFGETREDIEYVADFLITDLDDEQIVVDTKGFTTKDFVLKRKLFEYKYPDIIILLPGNSAERKKAKGLSKKKRKKGDSVAVTLGDEVPKRAPNLSNIPVVMGNILVDAGISSFTTEDTYLLCKCAINAGIIEHEKQYDSSVRTNVVTRLKRDKGVYFIEKSGKIWTFTLNPRVCRKINAQRKFM